MKNLTKSQSIYTLIGETNNGRMFSVTFTKKDGTIRKMSARRGVRKGINGNGPRYNAMTKGLLTVFDMAKQEWRNINLETILGFNANKNKYQVL